MYGLYLDFVSGGALEDFAALPLGLLLILRYGDALHHEYWRPPVVHLHLGISLSFW